jgi:DNA (cytosine-5)-methyltransferase 1
LDAKLRYVSLFSGCGGLDWGFEAAGFRCVEAFEKDRSSCDTFEENFTAKMRRCDISNLCVNDFTTLSDADLLLAGPPCQGFSTVGKNDPDDVRNSLLTLTAKIAAKHKPRMVLIENVPGLLSARNADNFNNVVGILRDADYEVSHQLFDLHDFGVPQTRKRVIIVGRHRGPKVDLSLKSLPRQSLRNALEDLPEKHLGSVRTLSEQSDEHRIASQILPGQKLSNVRSGDNAVHTWEIPTVYGVVTDEEASLLETMVRLRRQNRQRDFGDADPVPFSALQKAFGSRALPIIKSLLKKEYLREIGDHFDLSRTFNGKFRRLEWEKAAPTVHTRFGQARFFLHPDEPRGFTYFEAARLQTFPDEFSFSGTEAQNFTMIGNAVPPKFAEHLAKHIRNSWTAN